MLPNPCQNSHHSFALFSQYPEVPRDGLIKWTRFWGTSFPILKLKFMQYVFYCRCNPIWYSQVSYHHIQMSGWHKSPNLIQLTGRCPTPIWHQPEKLHLPNLARPSTKGWSCPCPKLAAGSDIAPLCRTTALDWLPTDTVLCNTSCIILLSISWNVERHILLLFIQRSSLVQVNYL